MQVKNAIKSVWFFSKLIFFKKEYDVVFIYRNTFIREDGVNHLLKPFIKSCEDHGLRYLLLESRHWQKSSGYRYLYGNDAVPFNLISFLQGKLRKVLSKPDIDYGLLLRWQEREAKIAGILQKLFFRNLHTKLFLTLVGNNNMIFLKDIYPDTLFAEYQHGIFWCRQDPSLFKRDAILRKTVYKKTTFLLYGKGFEKIFNNCPETMAYPSERLKVLGAYFPIPPYRHRSNNRTILYTLQNVQMDSNADYYQTIKDLIACNADFLQRHGYRIIFKNHPRYERNDALRFDTKYPFISFAEDNASMDILESVSLHITSKSTTALDAALRSIPTVFIDMLEVRSPGDIFFRQYHYPLTNFRVEKPADLGDILPKLEEEEYYGECSRKVYEWGLEYYQDFDEQVFLDLITGPETDLP